MRVSPTIEQAIINLRQACAANANWRVDIFDVMHLNEQEVYYRGRVKALLVSYRAWLKYAEKQRDVRVLAYSTLEGRALKNTLDEYIQVWRTIRMERKFLREIYYRQEKL